MKPKKLIAFNILTILSICSSLVSCEKSSTSTTYITTNEIPASDHQEAKSEALALATLPIDAELDSIKGKHSTGKLYLRYDNNTKEMKKWTILAPYEVKLHPSYIEVKFSGNYYIDGEPTGDGEKKLFIKKQDLKTILVSE